MRSALIFVGVGAIILAGGWWLLSRNDVTAKNEVSAPESQQEKTSTETHTNVIEKQGAATGNENLRTFACDDGKTITAVFVRDIVGLTLSDGRQVELRSHESDDAIEYRSNDSKIEFYGRGNQAFLSESGTVTYACTANE